MFIAVILVFSFRNNCLLFIFFYSTTHRDIRVIFILFIELQTCKMQRWQCVEHLAAYSCSVCASTNSKKKIAVSTMLKQSETIVLIMMALKDIHATRTSYHISKRRRKKRKYARNERRWKAQYFNKRCD